MKYILRILRWFKCQHRWEIYLMSDPMNPISNGNIIAPEKLNPNCEKIKKCSKCNEVRTFGKNINTLWI